MFIGVGLENDVPISYPNQEDLYPDSSVHGEPEFMWPTLIISGMCHGDDDDFARCEDYLVSIIWTKSTCSLIRRSMVNLGASCQIIKACRA